MEYEQAITDLINFVAEFELWLEDEWKQAYKMVGYRNGQDLDHGRYDAIDDAKVKYMELKIKNRIMGNSRKGQ